MVVLSWVLLPRVNSTERSTGSEASLSLALFDTTERLVLLPSSPLSLALSAVRLEEVLAETAELLLWPPEAVYLFDKVL